MISQVDADYKKNNKNILFCLDLEVQALVHGLLQFVCLFVTLCFNACQSIKFADVGFTRILSSIKIAKLKILLHVFWSNIKLNLILPYPSLSNANQENLLTLINLLFNPI